MRKRHRQTHQPERYGLVSLRVQLPSYGRGRHLAPKGSEKVDDEIYAVVGMPKSGVGVVVFRKPV